MCFPAALKSRPLHLEKCHTYECRSSLLYLDTRRGTSTGDRCFCIWTRVTRHEPDTLHGRRVGLLKGRRDYRGSTLLHSRFIFDWRIVIDQRARVSRLHRVASRELDCEPPRLALRYFAFIPSRVASASREGASSALLFGDTSPECWSARESCRRHEIIKLQEHQSIHHLLRHIFTASPLFPLPLAALPRQSLSQLLHLPPNQRNRR